MHVFAVLKIVFKYSTKYSIPSILIPPFALSVIQYIISLNDKVSTSCARISISSLVGKALSMTSTRLFFKVCASNNAASSFSLVSAV